MGCICSWWLFSTQSIKSYQMTEYIEKVKTWVMENKTIAIVVGAILAFVVFKKLGPKTYRRRIRRPLVSRRRKSLPRSVGMSKAGGSVNRIIKSGRHRGKKAWQIKGSPEARRHMAAIRRKKSRKLF